MIFTNTLLVSSTEVLESELSDHYIIICKLSTCKPTSKTDTVYRRDFSKFDKTKFFNYAKYLNCHKCEEIDCPHQAACYLEELVTSALDKFAPFKNCSIRSQKLKWRSPALAGLIKHKTTYSSYIKRLKPLRTAIYG